MSSTLRGNPANAVNFFFLVDIFTCVLGILILIALMLALQSKPSEIVLEPGVPPPLVKLDELTHTLENLTRSNEMLTAQLTKLQAIPRTEEMTRRLKELQLLQAKLQDSRQHLLAEQKKLRQLINKTLERYGVAGNLDKLGRLTNQLATVNANIARLQESNAVVQVKIEQARADVHKRETHRTIRIADLARKGQEPLFVVISREQVTVESGWNPNASRVLEWPVSEANFREALAPFDPLKSQVIFFVRPSGIGLFNALHAVAVDAHYPVGSDALEENMELAFVTGDSK